MIRSGNKAINSLYPQTEVQLCIIHQIRNSIKYAASKHHKPFMADLKPVCRAVSKEAAETALDELEIKWASSIRWCFSHGGENEKTCQAISGIRQIFAR